MKRKKSKNKIKRHGLIYLMKRKPPRLEFSFPDFPDFNEYEMCGSPLPAVEFNSPYETFSEVFWQNQNVVEHGDAVLFLVSADDNEGIPIFAIEKSKSKAFEKKGALVLEKNVLGKFSAVAGVYKWPKPGAEETV